MNKVIAAIVSLGLTVAFAAPVIAADKTPTTKAACNDKKLQRFKRRT